MPGLIIPGDRTTKQQARGYCMNPQCLESSLDGRFEFDVEHDRFACPKCGADTAPLVGLLVLTHWLVADMKGPLIGQMGRRYRLGCDSNRAYLATATNLEAASGDVNVVTCKGCLAAMAKLGPQPQGFSLLPQNQ